MDHPQQHCHHRQWQRQQDGVEVKMPANKKEQ